jgi:apolipoprotein N-acyltransferase
MVSTVGISGFVTSDGREWDATGFNTRAVRVRDLRLGAARTLATTLGPVSEYMLVGLGVLGLVAAITLRRRNRQTQEEL